MADGNTKGARLEQQVASYFRVNGYEADTNVRREGKSGGSHEIDVLAKKSDGITDITIAVECKAWSQPIEKDVVSKLSMVIGDLGINKGIIVSLQGWRSGAETAARQEGIELWGPAELAQRLGSVAVAELNGATANQYQVLGIQGKMVSDTDLSLALERESRGFMGMGREEEVWAGLVYVPFHLVELHHATVVKEFLRKPAVKMTPVFGLYNALDDSWFASYDAEPQYTSIEAPYVLPAKTKAKSLAASLVAAVKRAHEVTTSSALARHQEKLKTLGLPLNLENLSAERMLVVHYPFYLGLFRRRSNERIVAVEVFRGKYHPLVSTTLTANMGFVTKALNISDRSEN